MTNELATHEEQTGIAHMRQATNAASLCKEIVMKTACNIQGKKYVKCEGWQSIAVAHGCILSATNVEAIEGGWRATGEVRRMDTGAIIATAEGFVGKDESTWGGRKEYACRAMAQTRAMSRAARSAFAHVVVMIDAGLSTTPAEEVPAEGFKDANIKQPQRRSSNPARTSAPVPETPKTVEAHTSEPDSLECDEESVPDEDGILVSVDQVTKKENTKKPGTFRYGVKSTDGEWFNTFKEDFAVIAKSAKESGSQVRIKFITTKFGNDIEAIAQA